VRILIRWIWQPAYGCLRVPVLALPRIIDIDGTLTQVPHPRSLYSQCTHHPNKSPALLLSLLDQPKISNLPATNSIPDV
jgi:hypothetical protein